MNLNSKNYEEIYKKHSGKSTLLKDVLMAFLIGGLICTVGEGIRQLAIYFEIDKEIVPTIVSVSMIFIGVSLTVFRVYRKIANIAGAGTLVPITGFANAVSSPAIEFKSEGIIFGTCVKMFSIAGPVIVCGVSASIAYGLILCLIGG